MFSNITSCQVWEASSVLNTQTDSTRTAQMETELARTEVEQHGHSFHGRTRWPQHTWPGCLGFRIKDDFAFHYGRNLSERVVLCLHSNWTQSSQFRKGQQRRGCQGRRYPLISQGTDLKHPCTLATWIPPAKGSLTSCTTRCEHCTTVLSSLPAQIST